MEYLKTIVAVANLQTILFSLKPISVECEQEVLCLCDTDKSVLRMPSEGMPGGWSMP